MKPDFLTSVKKAKKSAGKFASKNAVQKNAKVKRVMGEFKAGTLHSGSAKGPKVTKRKQAIAIALSEQNKVNKGGY